LLRLKRRFGSRELHSHASAVCHISVQLARIMRFQTPGGASFIEIERRDEDGYAIFDVAVSIEGFTGRNRSVIFNSCAEFLSQIRDFDAKRDGIVTLTGTEGFQLSISTYDAAGHMRVDVRLCRHTYQASPRTVALTLEGGFVFDVEFANSLFRDLHELLRDCS